MRQVVVVGASAAGLSAAETLRREGFEGTLTLIGEEAHFPYDRPPLSKHILASHWEAAQVALRTPDQLTANRLDLRPGTRIVIVGAGFLGAECAAVAARLGCDVVLLEPAPVPLAHAVGEQVGRFLSRAHAEHGVDLRTGITVSAVTADGVLLADGTPVAADEVLVAIGSTPNIEWLGDSGLALADGLLCDQYSCAAPDVYGAGDVARWHNPLFGVAMRIEHRTNAAEQGMAAARNLLRPETRTPFAPVPYFWSDQYDMKIHAYGHLRDHDAVEIVEGDLGQRRFLAAYRRDDRLVGALAVGVPPKAIRRWRQAIAAATLWKDIR
jgi:NADPH-dependent 2,4-dienoyl-CoA reductase/sulfur reductase-like enzyme